MDITIQSVDGSTLVFIVPRTGAVRIRNETPHCGCSPFDLIRCLPGFPVLPWYSHYYPPPPAPPSDLPPFFNTPNKICPTDR